jgi:3',5'-cyclic AMP phosphodiesterase CpdA
MRLAWITDPHLNFVSPTTVDALCDEIEASGADALLLSGDIAESHDICGWLAHLSAALSVPIHFVLGNHDYYHGSIAMVRAAVARTVAKQPRLSWLSQSTPIWLTPTVALTGHGGWGDARLGRWYHTPIRLNDHHVIAELSGLPRLLLRERLHALGDEAAAHLRLQLAGCTSARQILVLTHVPPFAGACWHQGRLSGPDWLGDFACEATGLVLESFADSHPDIHLRVFCGHTHSAGYYQHRDNLTVTTGAAQYGAPALQPLVMVG